MEHSGRIVIDLKPNTWLTKEARASWVFEQCLSLKKHAHQDQASKVRRRMVAGAPGTFQSLALADAGMAQAREGAPEGSQIRRSPSAWC